MSKQDTTTSTTDTPDKRPEEERWTDIWLDIWYPHSIVMLAARRILWLTDERLRSLVNGALARVPEGLDLGHDDNGRPIIATEVLLHVLAEDREGRVAIISPRSSNTGWRRKVMGWETLSEYEERQREGEGVVEARVVKDPWEGQTAAGLHVSAKRYRIWVWNEAAAECTSRKIWLRN